MLNFRKRMEQPLTVCKVAVEVVRSCQDELDSIKTFHYRGNHWRFLDFLQTRLGSLDIQEVITAVNPGNPRRRMFEIDIIEDCGEKWLALRLIRRSNNGPWIEKFNLPSRVFSIFFHDDGNNFILATNTQESRNIIKKYVTTSLFEALYQKHLSLSDPDTTNQDNMIPQLPTCFRPELCRYQQKAVAWMCKRERKPTKMPQLYVKLRAKDNETIVYAHRVCPHVLDTEPETVALPPGGILADEMGLGKTVEILALILLHPRPPFRDLPDAFFQEDFSIRKPKRLCLPTVFCLCGSSSRKKLKNANIQCTKCKLWQHTKCVCRFNGEHDETTINNPYICPHCWSDTIHKKQKQLLPSRATIIVSPNTIKLQWLSEIQKHVYPSLRVFLYDGISKNVWISPRQLADYDVVLTDYNVLRKEFYHTADKESDRVTRKKPRHMRCNTPLLMIQWWRVCLDEAQMVESNVSKTAELALQLPAINRWAVTGTPIQNSIDDLHSLLVFIGFDQICYPRIIWDNLVRFFLTTTTTTEEPAPEANTLLIDMLQLCMWRTCKSHILNELKIPPQTEEVHYITLSHLEKLFYSEQHATCEDDFNEKFVRYKIKEEISPQIMKILLEPLLKIRQCCTIPVVVSNSNCKANNLIGQRKFLQPKQLHTHLKSTNEMECKAELRSMASSYNGMAGIYFIRKKYADAIKHYELVLQLARDYTELNINVDSLLQIHALHNILQAVYTSSNKEELLPANRVADCEDQCNKLEWKYLETYASQMKSVQEAFEAEKETYYTTATNVEMDLNAFVAALVEIIATDDLHKSVMEKIYDECVQVFSNCETMKMVTSIHSALYVVTTWHDKVVEVIQDLNSRFKQLEFFTNNVRSRSQVAASVWRDMMKFVNKVNDCHMSEIRFKRTQNDQSKSSQKQAPLCDLCEIRDILNNYECWLFNKVIDKETNMIEGLENPSPQITLIKAIFNFTKSKPKFHRFTSEFDKHWERIKCMERMCKKMWKYWIEIEYTVKAYDELNMCKMRISITQNKEERSNFRLLESEVEAMINEQYLNFQTAQTAFASKLARLKYILHLEKNSDPGPCPICHSDDEPRYAVLECGHHICLICLNAMQSKFYKNKKLTCSICRNQQASKKIYYVTRTNEGDAMEFNIRGNYSSKISFIVNQVLKLQKEANCEENGPKIIIFSQWQPILGAIAAALVENGIRHLLKWSPTSIEDFKNPHLNITCLLMVLSKGSKGLNLIEATHVFLVEPILNPAEELQAIGRVHRFGQTKPTTVHRFIVLNTIEENIFYTVTRGKETYSKWEFEDMDPESLRNLFNFENDVIHCC